jgi:NTP pyrophosphatase (non-canonical NTP hydrolase)
MLRRIGHESQTAVLVLGLLCSGLESAPVARIKLRTPAENAVTLSQLQADVSAWIEENGGYWGKFEILARLVEEVGEVSAALQRAEGLRPRARAVDLSDEIGDVLFTLTVLANVHGLRLEEALRSTLRKYTERDAPPVEGKGKYPL